MIMYRGDLVKIVRNSYIRQIKTNRVKKSKPDISGNNTRSYICMYLCIRRIALDISHIFTTMVQSNKLMYCKKSYRQILMTVSHGFTHWKYNLTTAMLRVSFQYYA